ncbi:MAG: hydrogenase [Planctomycetes bacterium]|nr:hydrogenase [Planctomycetota bacterium]
MAHTVNPLLVAILLMNLATLGASRLRAVIDIAALQGIVLGGLVLLAHEEADLRAALLAAAVIGIKGFVIPYLLVRAMRAAAIRREVEPIVGFLPSLLLGAVATAGALVCARTLPLAPAHQGDLLVPASIATALTGFLVLTTRRKAITQVVGYLILENGIFLLGLTLIEAMPFLVEMGALLDLFVGVFVLGIIIHHISREFASLDTGRLTALKE